eukprot:COSAG05_NODE_3924_length_1772_cov_69.567244_3_plen_118_part_01
MMMLLRATTARIATLLLLLLHQPAETGGTLPDTTVVSPRRDVDTSAAELFVSPQGSDDNGDGTRAHPWQSLERVAAAARSGDIVSLLPGTYRRNRTLVLSDAASGVRFRSHPDNTQPA